MTAKRSLRIKFLARFFKREEFAKSRFSRINLAVFGLIFAGIGGYLIFNSFAATTLMSLHISGSQLLDSNNNAVALHGVDRAGTEYACEQGWGIFDGSNSTNDDAEPPLIASWHVNSEFVGLNEDCWLGINGVPSQYAGANYQAAIEHYVQTIEANGMYPVIGFFWGAPGSTLATGQPEMPDNDHTPLFWQQVADAFKNDPNVIFRLQEEPHPGNGDTSLNAWKCWSQGDVQYDTSNTLTPVSSVSHCSSELSNPSYQAVGMQSLVNIIRGTGASNIIQVPGVAWTNMVACSSTGSPVSCGILDSTDGVKLSDPYSSTNPQLMIDMDMYPDSGQDCDTTTCYDDTMAPVASEMPLVLGEIGPSGSTSTQAQILLGWMDDHGGNYYAWAWDSWAGLIKDYTSGTPASPWGTVYYDHINNIVPPPPAQPTDGIKIVQTGQTACAGGGSTVDLSNSVNAGDDIFLVIDGQGYTGPAAYPSSVSDNNNDTWTQLVNTESQTNDNTKYDSYAVYALTNAKAAPSGLKITINVVSGQSGLSAQAVELSGVGSISASGFQSNIQASANNLTGPALASVPTNDMVLGLFGAYGTPYYSAPTGWNTDPTYQINNQYCASAAFDWTQPSATGPVTAAIDTDGTPGYYGGALDLHPAGSTSAPSINFSANPTSINYGGNSTLAWSSTNATSCSASSSDNDNAFTGSIGLSGSKAVSPANTKSGSIVVTYTVTCTGAGGTNQAFATVNVGAPPPVQPTDGIVFRQAGQTACVSASSGKVALSQAVVAGDDLFLVIGGQGYTGPASSVTSVSDNVNGDWTQMANTGSQTNDNTEYTSYAVYELQDSKAAANGLTVTVQGVGGQSGMSAEVLDVGGVGSVTQKAFSSVLQTNGPPMNSPALSSVPANDVVLGLFGSYTVTSFSAPSGWNMSNGYWVNNNFCASAAFDWTQPTFAGPITATITPSGYGQYFGGLLDLHPGPPQSPESSPPPTPPTPNPSPPSPPPSSPSPTPSPPPSFKPGDVNHDGVVNIYDLSILLSHYGTNYPNAEFTGHSTVTIYDLSVLLSRYGK